MAIFNPLLHSCQRRQTLNSPAVQPYIFPIAHFSPTDRRPQHHHYPLLAVDHYRINLQLLAIEV